MAALGSRGGLGLGMRVTASAHTGGTGSLGGEVPRVADDQSYPPQRTIASAAGADSLKSSGEPLRAVHGRGLPALHTVGAAGHAAARGGQVDEGFSGREPEHLQQIVVLALQMGLRFGCLVPAAVALEPAASRLERREQLRDLLRRGRGRLRCRQAGGEQQNGEHAACRRIGDLCGEENARGAASPRPRARLCSAALAGMPPEPATTRNSTHASCPDARAMPRAFCWPWEQPCIRHDPICGPAGRMTQKHGLRVRATFRQSRGRAASPA